VDAVRPEPYVSHWRETMVQLDRLASAALRELCIGFEHRDQSVYADAHVLEGFFGRLDWRTLGSLAGRCSSLRTLRPEACVYVAKERVPRRYLGAVEAVASRRLPSQRGHAVEVVLK
jgi:hypothetical protein